MENHRGFGMDTPSPPKPPLKLPVAGLVPEHMRLGLALDLLGQKAASIFIGHITHVDSLVT